MKKPKNKVKKQPKVKPKNKRSIEDLERIVNERPIRGLSHAWLIGAAKRELDKLNNTES